MNSGKVQLDVVLRGKDEVTAVLAQVEKQAKETEKQLNAIGDADIRPDVGGISKVGGALGGALEAVDQAEEKFNKLVGAIGFVGAAFGAVTGIYSFIKGLLDSSKAIENTKKSVQSLTEYLTSAQDKLRGIDVSRAPNEAAKEAIRLEQERTDLLIQQSEITLLRIPTQANLFKLEKERAKVAKQLSESQIEYVTTAEGEVLAVDKSLQLKKEISKIDQQIREARSGINLALSAEEKFAREIKTLEAERLGLLKQSTIEILNSVGFYDRLVNKSRILTSIFKGAGLMPKAEDEAKPPGGTGPRRKTPAEIGEERTRERIENDARTAEAMARLDKSLAEQEASRAKLQAELSSLEDMQENQAILEEEIRLFDEYTDSIYEAADAFDTLSNALGKSLDLFPEIGAGFRGVQDAMQKHAEFVKANEEQVAQGFLTSAEAVTAGEESKTKAIISGSTEGLAAIGKLVGGLKAEYALRSAGELAMGFATLANPIESAGHFVAAGLFAVAAGKAASSGGAGAGVAGGDSEAPASSSSLGYGDGGGGQRTIVYNFSTLLADRQQVHRAIRDSELVGARNGYGRRRGV